MRLYNMAKKKRSSVRSKRVRGGLPRPGKIPPREAKQKPEPESDVVNLEPADPDETYVDLGLEFFFHTKPAFPEKEEIMRVLKSKMGDVVCIGEEPGKLTFYSRKLSSTIDGHSVPMRYTLYGLEKVEGNFLSPKDLETIYRYDDGDTISAFFRKCRWHIRAEDFVVGRFSPEDRAKGAVYFIDAIMELFPDCVGFYVPYSMKLVPLEYMRVNELPPDIRFLHYTIQMRFTESSKTRMRVITTLGMKVLKLPDVRYSFHTLPQKAVLNHCMTLLVRIFRDGIKTGDVVDGLLPNGTRSSGTRWTITLAPSREPPDRTVALVNTGRYSVQSGKKP